MKILLVIIIIYSVVMTIGSLFTISALLRSMDSIYLQLKIKILENEEGSSLHKKRYDAIQDLFHSINDYYRNHPEDKDLHDKLKSFFDEVGDEITPSSEIDTIIKNRIEKSDIIYKMIDRDESMDKILDEYRMYIEYSLVLRTELYNADEFYKLLCNKLSIPYSDSYIYPSIGNVINIMDVGK